MIIPHLTLTFAVFFTDDWLVYWLVWAISYKLNCIADVFIYVLMDKGIRKHIKNMFDALNVKASPRRLEHRMDTYAVQSSSPLQ